MAFIVEIIVAAKALRTDLLKLGRNDCPRSSASMFFSNQLRIGDGRTFFSE
jgi:hypothetical protein